MSLPLGMVCEGCGTAMGMVTGPDSEKLILLELTFACPTCIDAASVRAGVVGSDSATWDKVKAEIRRG
jgi:hypothetical protein